MGTYTQILYHIVFSTKNRDRVLLGKNRDELLRYTCGVVVNQKGHVYRINAVEDHLHMLSSLHPTVCLANSVKDIKLATSSWIKEKGLFPDFTQWQIGYAAFTHSNKEKDRLVKYIANQQEHHRKMTFREELEHLLKEAGIEFDEKYLL